MKIKGLEEYGSVRDAYDEIEKALAMIRNSKAFIESHKAGTEFLKAEEGKEFDSKMEEADEALAEGRKIICHESSEIYDMLTKTPLYDTARKQWNRYIDAGQNVKETTRQTVSLLPGVIALASIGRAGEAEERYNLLLQSPLYDRETRQWNISMTAAQQIESTGISSLEQLMNLIALACIGKIRDGEKIYALLMQTPLYDAEKKQWNDSMTQKQKISDSTRYASTHLLEVIALSCFERKNDAETMYEALKNTEFYDASCGQWNYSIDKKQKLTDERHSLTNLIGVSALAAIGRTSEARETYGMLKETRLYDKARKQWNWLMNAAQTVENTYRPAFSQLWGVIALAMLEGGKLGQ